MPNRNHQIDILRGIGIITMILIHVVAWYKSDRLAYNLWNYSQFAVQIFVFCSGYLFFVKESARDTVCSLGYFAKRAWRLALPFYVFFLFYYPLEVLESSWKLNWNYFFKSLFLVGGTDPNWVTLLFIQLSIAMALGMYLYKKFRLGFYALVSLSLLSSLVFLALQVTSYKWIMWLPWMAIVFASWFFTKLQNKTSPLYLGASAGVATILLGMFLEIQNKSLIFFDNKYPPNIFYILYGLAAIGILWYVIGLFDLEDKRWDWVRFFSVNSYSLFFIHFWVFLLLRGVLKLQYGWWIMFILVLTCSTLIQLLINKLLRLRNKTS